MLSQIIKIGADATGAQRVVAGLAGVTNKAFSAVGKEITSRLVGAFAAGVVIDKIAGFARDTIEYADNIGDLAENLGITVEEVQRLQVASGLAGVKFQKMQVLLEKVNALQAEALQGDKKALGIFGALGLDPKTANALQIMQAAVKNQGVATELFDRKAKSVANTMEKLRNLGPIQLITEKQIEALGKANDKIDEASRKLKVASAPVITSGLNALSSMFRTITGGGFDQLIEGTELGKRLKYLESDEDKMVLNPIFNSIPPKAKEPPPIQTSPLALAAQSDALGRIGLFVGGRSSVGDQLVSIGNYQLSELRAVRQILQEANR